MIAAMALWLQDGMQAATAPLGPDSPLERRHLWLAYGAVIVIQVGYAAWVLIARACVKRGGQ